jgi:hypothetical protein
MLTQRRDVTADRPEVYQRSCVTARMAIHAGLFLPAFVL